MSRTQKWKHQFCNKYLYEYFNRNSQRYAQICNDLFLNVRFLTLSLFCFHFPHCKQIMRYIKNVYWQLLWYNIVKSSGAQFCYVSGAMEITSTGLQECICTSFPNSGLRNVILVTLNWSWWFFIVRKSGNATNLTFYYRKLVVKYVPPQHSAKTK